MPTRRHKWLNIYHLWMNHIDSTCLPNSYADINTHSNADDFPLTMKLRIYEFANLESIEYTEMCSFWWTHDLQRE